MNSFDKNVFNSNYLYNSLELSKQQFSPFRINIVNILSTLKYFENSPLDNNYLKIFRASYEIAERLTRTYKKPEFNILNSIIDNQEIEIEQTAILTKSFCKLLHFKKVNYTKPQAKLLIVAPLAGHYATLLRDTVSQIIPYFDIYITDWTNANLVLLSEGKFDLSNYIEYMIEFFRYLAPDLHVFAVCQPTIPVLAATAYLSKHQDICNIPKSLILMGGPVDARKNPTQVDLFATENSLAKIEQMMITEVPGNYPGAGRKVYPGFFQLLSFISMNIDRHIGSHLELYKNLVLNTDTERYKKQQDFYDEYCSVMDIPAEFYLQTIKEVFQDFMLAKGQMQFRNELIDLSAIHNVALLGIEGELDDIAAIGQTKAALDLCFNIDKKNKIYYLQKDVGHYGIFSGSKYRKFIVPVIRNFIKKFDSK